MTHKAQSFFSVTTLSILFGIAVVLPISTHAADFAYVNTSGLVELITADNSSLALLSASNLDPHSGVCLLDSADDYSILGSFLRGI